MRRHTLHTRRTLRTVLGGALALTALAVLIPTTADAGLVVRASINAPVRATVVVGDTPHVGVLPQAIARRTVVTRAPDRCCCGADQRPLVRVKHHRHGHRQHRMVWVPGHWEQVSRRTSRWIPGHWERI